MYARVMTSSPKPGSADTAIAEWPQHIGAFKGKGLVAGYLFFDRAANQFLSITIWESEAAMAASEAGGEERRRRRAEISGASVDSVDHYEVGLIAVAPGVQPAGRRPQPAEEPGEEHV